MKPDTSRHPEPILLAAYGDGNLQLGPDADAIEAHLERCAACRAALVAAAEASMNDLEAPPDEFAAAARAPDTPRVRWRVAAAAVATLAILGGAAWYVGRSQGDAPVFRGGDAAEVVLESPASDADSEGTTVALRWRAVEGVELYRIAIDDSRGIPVARLEVLPPAVEAHWTPPPHGHESYRWRVDAMAGGRIVASSTVGSFRRP